MKNEDKALLYDYNKEYNTLLIKSLHLKPTGVWKEINLDEKSIIISHYLSSSIEIFQLTDQGDLHTFTYEFLIKRPSIVLIVNAYEKELYYSHTKGSINHLPAHSLNIFNTPSASFELILPHCLHKKICVISVGYKRAEEFLCYESESFKSFVMRVEKGIHCNLYDKAFIWGDYFKFLLLRLDKSILKKEQTALYVQSVIIDMLLFCFENIPDIAADKSRNSYLRKEDKVIKAKHIIDKDWRDLYTIDRLCKEVGLNTTQLKEGFKLMYQVSIFKYQNQFRLEKSKSLLLNKGFSIADIAETAGYKNPQHYSAAFKKEFKITPSQFRKNSLE